MELPNTEVLSALERDANHFTFIIDVLAVK